LCKFSGIMAKIKNMLLAFADLIPIFRMKEMHIKRLVALHGANEGGFGDNCHNDGKFVLDRL